LEIAAKALIDTHERRRGALDPGAPVWYNNVTMGLSRKSICIFVVTLCCVLPASVYGEAIQIEAEDTTATYDMMFAPIQVIDSPGCSGTILQGLDYVGEWAEYDLSVSEFGRSTYWIRCRGDLGTPYTFHVTFTGNQSGESQTIDVNFVGQGMG
jgi:hypothetical protein